MTTGEGAKPPGMATGAIVLLVATLALTYIVSQFLRNSVGDPLDLWGRDKSNAQPLPVRHR